MIAAIARAPWPFIVAAMLALAAPANAAVRTLVAIGNDVGLRSDEPLRWAEDDALRINDVMVDVGGVASTRAMVLLGEDMHGIERALLQVRGQIEETRRRGERTELVLTFSGHGDSEALHVQGTSLPVKTLLSWLDAIPADATVVILDACRTGVVRSGGRKGAIRGPAFDVTLVEEPAPTGRVVIASASDGEVAQESDDLEGAFFTHHLLAGLRGAADQNNDGVVVLAELYAYAHARTLAHSFGSAAVQHPELRASLTGQGEVVMTRLKRAQATLVLDAALDGSFLIVDARAGRVLFEVHKQPGVPLALAVPARRLRVQRRLGSLSSLAELDMVRGARTPVGPADLVEVLRVAGRGRGVDVDVTPWGASAGLLLTNAPALARDAMGLHARVERRLWQTPLFVDATVMLAAAEASDATRLFREVDARAHVGLAAETWTLLGRLSAGLGLGVHVASQRVEAKDAARLRGVGLDDAALQEGNALGPLVAGRASWWIPVAGPVAIEAGVHGVISGLVVDDVLAPRAYGGVTCGLALEF